MFLIFNKQKLYSYIVTLSTVIVLFVIAAGITSQRKEEIITTSSSSKLLPIYSVDTEQNKVAFTMNCAWSQ